MCANLPDVRPDSPVKVIGEKFMPAELMQPGVLVPIIVSIAFAVVLLFCTIEDALRQR